MILSITLNTSVDHALFLDTLKLGDTNRVLRTETDAGGKGVNLARVAAEMGADSLATGFLGGGPGAFVRRVLDDQGVRHTFVETNGETRTNFSVEDGSGSPPTTFNARGPQVTSAELKALWSRCRELAVDARWVAMGGSLPPGTPVEIYRDLAAMAAESDCRVLVDADGEAMHRALEAHPSLVKPNAKEASRLLGRTVETRDDALAAAQEIRMLQGGGTAIALVTLGAGGAALASEDALLFGSSPQVEARSTIGSGDSMLGAFLWALSDARPVAEALQWGLAAGAATAATDGSEIARRPMVIALFEQARVERL